MGADVTLPTASIPSEALPLMNNIERIDRGRDRAGTYAFAKPEQFIRREDCSFLNLALQHLTPIWLDVRTQTGN